MDVPVEFLVLGPLEVRVGGTAVTLRGGRPRTLLHALLLNRRIVQPVEVLADRLWERDPPLDGPNAVHQLVSYLRRSLGPIGRELLVTTATGYRLDVADECIDAERLERLVRSAMTRTTSRTAPDVRRGLAEADEALRLWRGEPYAESAHHAWLGGERARLQETYLQAQQTRLDALLALGRHREVVLEAQSLTTAYPLREKLHAQLSLALYRTGRQGEALEVHRCVRDVLAHELGLDPGAELRDLEVAILRQDPSLDWAEPYDELATRADATPSSGPVPHAVVEPPLPMVGREHDLATATATMRTTPVYTVTGPAGVGKTRLALALAAGDDRPVWWVDLSSVTSGEDVTAAVADALDLGPGAGQDVLATVTGALRSTEGLLVLDTCEHVVAGVGSVVAALRDVAPSLGVLLTSRRPVGAIGETVHQLAPLSVPPADLGDAEELAQSPAVRMFCDRAQALRADFAATDERLRDIAAMVRTLDGLPLAIEIAASNSDVLTTAMLRQRIEAHAGDLGAEGAAVSPRSRSLTAALDASVVLLTPAEREVLWALSVFPGGFTVEAAAAVAARDEDEVLARLASLVRQSLVVLDERHRLLGPVRAYAARRADAELDVEELRKRHAAWVASVAGPVWKRAGGLRGRHELATLRPLVADARAAMAWSLEKRRLEPAATIAVAFSWVWTLHGLAAEGLDWLLRVRRLSDEEGRTDTDSVLVRATVLRTLGLLANPMGQLQLARDACTEAITLCEANGDVEGAAAAGLTLAVSTWALGDVAASARAADRAAELVDQRPDTWTYVAARALRARAALDLGEPGADELIEEATSLAQAADEPHLLGLALACRARLSSRDGHAAASAVAATEALRVWRRIDYREGEVLALNLLARVDTDSEAAAAHAREALGLARAVQLRGGMCESVESLALLAAADGRREHAALLLAVAARERARLSAPVPPADAADLATLAQELRDALGNAAPLVDARSRVTRFDDFVDELLA